MATKTSTPIIETLQAVFVITRDQLDDQNPQTVGNALRYMARVLSDADVEQQAEDYLVLQAVQDCERRMSSG